MQRLETATAQMLKDAGCDAETIRRFCALEESPGSQARKQQAQLLRARRRELLAQMHACQERLDCLDYALYRLRAEPPEDKERKDDEP